MIDPQSQVSVNPLECVESIARLLEYPRELDARKARGAADWIAPAAPEAAESLRTFAARIDGMSIEELQELFTRTFDLNPVCSLEIGWHLYGEQYERGRFLVRLRDELRRHGVRESQELPDHLTHVLRLIGRLDPGDAQLFISQYALPAIDRMLAAMPEDNAFHHVLEAARQLTSSAANRTEEPSNG